VASKSPLPSAPAPTPGPFPAPTEKQARILWGTLTTLSISVVVTLGVLLLWVIGWIIAKLSSVLLPLAMAGVLAYLLDPVVDFLEKRGKIPRPRAILLVFFLTLMLLLTLMATVVPKLIFETQELVDNLPRYAEQARTGFSNWLARSPLGIKAKQAWDQEMGATVQDWLAKSLPTAAEWLWLQATKVASWAGLLAGLALVPVYIFYFLLEKKGIQRKWMDYLPMQESKIKHEIVFVVRSINDCLIVFFRGQVLVALCTGTLLTIGFLLMGLPYALLLGVMAAVLGVVPYLGVAISLVPALAIAAIQFGDWWHPLGVLGIFAIVQMAEGLFISPKIIGDRVGLHPLTIIIAVMVGTTLLGGVLGGLLAIPLTAALRTLMFRYVWKER
jgi:predicted PurR-regulated permease PerM